LQTGFGDLSSDVNIEWHSAYSMPSSLAGARRRGKRQGPPPVRPLEWEYNGKLVGGFLNVPDLEYSIMTSRLFAISVIGLCWVVPLRADTLVMIGGERIQGEIVGETPSDVSIRRTNKTGNIRFVQKIRRVNIASIERSATQPASVRSQDFSSSRPAEAERSTPAARIADKPAFLEGAILKYEKPDYYAAGLDLNLLIVNSTPGELQQFSATVTDRLNMSLAEMAASAHFNAAMERSRGRAVQLPPVTDYEKPVLIPMLEEAYERALQTQVETEPETADRPRGREATDGRHEAAVEGGEG